MMRERHVADARLQARDCSGDGKAELEPEPAEIRAQSPPSR